MAKGSRFPSWIIPAGLAALLLYFSLRGVEWRRVGQIIAAARWSYLAGSVALGLLAAFGRAARWRILLNATETKSSLVTVFCAMMAGYLGNLVLPARAGELVRTFLISRHSGLTKTYVLTTALGERVMDAIALILFSSLALLGVESKPAWMSGVARSLAAVAIAAAAGVAVLPYIHGWIERVLKALPLPAKLRDKLLGLLEQMILGLRAFHDPKRFAAFAGLTLAVWLLDTCGMLITGRALGLPITFRIALLFLSALGLGSALPSTPGYLGIFQFVAVTVLGPFGIARDAALAYVIVVQAGSSVLVIIFGALGMIRLGGTLNPRVLED
jgi:uncharacterized protein (TIRG00374 family)